MGSALTLYPAQMGPRLLDVTSLRPLFRPFSGPASFVRFANRPRIALEPPHAETIPSFILNQTHTMP